MDVKCSQKPMCRSLWRLAVIIKLIFRIFTPKIMLVQQESRSAQCSVKKPTLLELSTVNNKRKLSERIHQRLLHGHLDVCAVIPVDDRAMMTAPSVLSCDVQNVLISPPWNRSSVLLEKAHKELQTFNAFNDFPTAVQKSICKLGWYQMLEANRVIYIAGCEPTSYYLLLSGSVAEVDGNAQSDEVKLHHAGSCFGDAAIIDGTSRVTTCYAKDQVELIVVSRSDYTDLSLRQTRRSYHNSKHYIFCKTISILKQWPLDELSAENCSQCYYKPGAVIVKDSKKSDYIYIVMSGSCHVIKRFIDNSASAATLSKVHHKSLTSDAVATKSPLSTQCHSHNRRMDGEEKSVDNATDEQQNFKKLRDRRATYPNFQEENESDKPKGKPLLIQLQILHPKDIFGLSTILYDDEPSISLVSNGSECVLIARSFILAHMGDRIKTWLYKQVQQFPSQEMMLKRIREHQSWNMYKQTLLGHLKKKHA